MPPETPAEVTDLACRASEQAVLGLPKVRHVFAAAAGGVWGRGASFNPTRFSLNVELEPRRGRGMSASDWVELARTTLEGLPELADAEVYLRPPRIRGLRTSTGTEDIEVKVFGEDLDALQKIGLDLRDRLAAMPGLTAVESSYQETSPEVRVELDRRRAADLGLDVGEVGRTVRTAVGGSVPTRLTEADREIDIRVRFARSAVQTAADLAAVPLFPRSGRAAAAARRRRPSARALAPQCDRAREPEPAGAGDGLGAAGALVGRRGDGRRPARARRRTRCRTATGCRFGGQDEAIRSNQRVLLGAIALAIFLVFAVMAVQYESLVDPAGDHGRHPARRDRRGRRPRSSPACRSRPR